MDGIRGKEGFCLQSAAATSAGGLVVDTRAGQRLG